MHTSATLSQNPKTLFFPKKNSSGPRSERNHKAFEIALESLAKASFIATILPRFPVLIPSPEIATTGTVVRNDLGAASPPRTGCAFHVHSKTRLPSGSGSKRSILTSTSTE